MKSRLRSFTAIAHDQLPRKMMPGILDPIYVLKIFIAVTDLIYKILTLKIS